jgi:uncharacterized protein YecE (DUF72 family)
MITATKILLSIAYLLSNQLHHKMCFSSARLPPTLYQLPPFFDVATDQEPQILEIP